MLQIMISCCRMCQILFRGQSDTLFVRLGGLEMHCNNIRQRKRCKGWQILIRGQSGTLLIWLGRLVVQLNSTWKKRVV